MSTFDPADERRILMGDCGYAFSLSRDIDQSKKVGGRGSSAHAFLGKAVRCMLNGLFEPASLLLRKAEQWVTVALGEGEIPQRFLDDARYLPYYDSAFRYKTLALSNWLLQGKHDADSYRKFVEFEDRLLECSEDGKDKIGLSLVLPTYVDAGAYQRVLQFFAPASVLTAPKSIRSIRTEAHMSYVLCRHRLNQEYTEAEVNSATRKFLDSNMNTWLCNGHSVRAVEWMKIVYWREGKASISAKDAVLMCYEHLPNCNRPF